MTIRLHWSPDSANLVVRMALEELGLPYEGVRVDRSQADHRRSAYLALNPQGLIPVLEDDGIVLFETGAILLHLADRTGLLGSKGPDARNPAARAAFIRWLFWLSNTLHADLRAAFHTGRYVEEPCGPLLRKGLARRLSDHIALVEGAMESGNWPSGPAPLLTDLYLAAALRWARLYPAGSTLLDTAPQGRVGALLASLGDRPPIRRALAAEAISDPSFLDPVRPDLPAAEITG